jgi:hypothetical protein
VKLTAAHCKRSDEGTTIRTGHSVSKHETTAIACEIRAIISHPKKMNGELAN